MDIWKTFKCFSTKCNVHVYLWYLLHSLSYQYIYVEYEWQIPKSGNRVLFLCWMPGVKPVWKKCSLSLMIGLKSDSCHSTLKKTCYSSYWSKSWCQAQINQLIDRQFLRNGRWWPITRPTFPTTSTLSIIFGDENINTPANSSSTILYIRFIFFAS